MLRHTCCFKLANDGVDTERCSASFAIATSCTRCAIYRAQLRPLRWVLEGLSLGTKEQARFYGQGCCWPPRHLCRDDSMRSERRGFLLDRGLLGHGRCGGRGLVLDPLRLARHRAGEHL